MRGALLLTAVLVALPLDGRVLACGDKFFMMGRGERFSKAYASIHPGTILVYTSDVSLSAKERRDARFYRNLTGADLTRAGHRVAVATTPTELTEALRSGPVDILLTDQSRAADLATIVASSGSKPTLVLVSEGGKGTARLKASDDIRSFLVEIEDAMKARAAAGLWHRGG